MLRPGGYACLSDPEAGVQESDTYTCVHCNRIVHVKPRPRDEEYFCRNCMARICSPCADHPCIPFMKKIEQLEQQERARRSYGF